MEAPTCTTCNGYASHLPNCPEVDQETDGDRFDRDLFDAVAQLDSLAGRLELADGADVRAWVLGCLARFPARLHEPAVPPTVRPVVAEFVEVEW
jgi:hypothetical protein